MLRSHRMVGDQRVDEVFYGILREEWKEGPGRR